MNQLLKLVALALVAAPWVGAFPAHRSLGGLSKEQLETIIPRLHVAPPENPPGQSNDTATRLVDDTPHPYIAPGLDDLRGPCPGLNTLANHGYIPRNGIATPAQIINAVQDGFNMENALAKFVTYAGLLVDGNPITNLMSIGGKSHLTGEDPVGPAIVGGLSTPSLFEGDVSLTRTDSFFGDAITFNQTLWDQLVDYSNRFGGGKFNLTTAGELRYQRIQESIATNPQFSLIDLRYFTAYSETSFPINFWVDGRQNDGQLDLVSALSFFRDNRFPAGFFRAASVRAHEGVEVITAAHLVTPGTNQGQINTYTPDLNSADLTTLCKLYNNFVNNEVKKMYPAPTGVLRTALNRNLGFLYEYFEGPDCPQIFPYGQ